MEARSKTTSRLKSKSLKNQNTLHTSTAFEQEIAKENQKMLLRIKEAKPAIGTKTEWKLHFQNFKANERKLRKYSTNKSYDPEAHLRDTLSSLNHHPHDKYTLDRLESVSRGNVRLDNVSRGNVRVDSADRTLPMKQEGEGEREKKRRSRMSSHMKKRRSVDRYEDE